MAIISPLVTIGKVDLAELSDRACKVWVWRFRHTFLLKPTTETAIYMRAMNNSGSKKEYYFVYKKGGAVIRARRVKKTPNGVPKFDVVMLELRRPQKDWLQIYMTTDEAIAIVAALSGAAWKTLAVRNQTMKEE